MKIHKPTIISLAFLAAVYLVIQWRGNTASVEKNSQSSSETQSEATKSDKEKGVNEAETSSEDTTPEKADSKAVRIYFHQIRNNLCSTAYGCIYFGKYIRTALSFRFS